MVLLLTRIKIAFCITIGTQNGICNIIRENFVVCRKSMKAKIAFCVTIGTQNGICNIIRENFVVCRKSMKATKVCGL